MSNYGTPYDDSFRTLLTDCKRLIVPLVNEMFGENWQETENVELYQNEVFITTGADEKRITDSNFTIGNSRRYHIECQSSVDGTMTVRIFEYSTQMEKDHALIEDMKNTYLKLWDQLESLVQQGKISEFEKSAIKAMCDKVAQSLTNKYDNVKEGVDSVMGGEILDYEAKRIRNESRNESNIEAVYNMLVANVDESVVQRMYPEQFEAGKKRFVSSKHVNV